MMTDAFETIDCTTLDTVAGGLSGGETHLSNYEACVRAMKRMPGSTPERIRQACGDPPES